MDGTPALIEIILAAVQPGVGQLLAKPAANSGAAKNSPLGN